GTTMQKIQTDERGTRMHLNAPRSRLAATLLALVLVGLASPPAMALDKVVLGLDWQARGRHAGFCTAQATGLYEMWGSDVDRQGGRRFGRAAASRFGERGRLCKRRKVGDRGRGRALSTSVQRASAGDRGL